MLQTKIDADLFLPVSCMIRWKVMLYTTTKYYYQHFWLLYTGLLYNDHLSLMAAETWAPPPPSGCYTQAWLFEILLRGYSCFRDCLQITFVMLNRFCPLSNPPPPSHPLFLMDNIKMDRMQTQIKCKILAPFILTNFYKTANWVSSPWQRFTCKKLTKTLQQPKLTLWSEPCALTLEKNRTSLLPYNFCHYTVDCVFKTYFKVININKLMLLIFFWKVMSWILLFHLLF